MPLPDPAAAGPAYAGVRTRLTDLLVAAGPDAADVVVPACPDWTVRDVVAHLAGACEDILAGRLEGVATPAWTDAQVQRLAGESLPALLDLWGVVGPQVEAITGAFPPAAAAQWTFDAVTHEHDLRGALGEPGARDSEAISVAAAFLEHSLGAAVRARSLPPLAVELDGEELLLGEGEPAVRLRTTTFELVRSFGGRRSEAQVRSLDWDGDPEAYLGLLGPILTPPTADLLE